MSPRRSQRRVERLGVALVAGLVAALGAACSADSSSDASSNTSSNGSSDPAAVTSDGPPTSAPDGSDASATVPDAAGPATSVPADAVLPEGFTTVEIEVTAPDGEVCVVCMWLADTSEERSRGLTDVTHLGDPVGMAFVYDEPSGNRFLMYRAPMPLSIAWFDASGSFVGAADMDPCLDQPRDDCPRYPSPEPFTLAIEVPQGSADDLGAVPGSSARVIPGSEADGCTSAE